MTPSGVLFLLFVTPLGFTPKTFRTFSDLIQLNIIRELSLFSDFIREFCHFLVTPLGFKPKTFRTFFWPHSAKCHQRIITF